MNEVLMNIHARRSVRAFADKAIPQPVLQDILQAGLSAPSAMNNQLWQLTAVSNPDKLTGLQHAVQTVLHRPDYGKFYGAATLVLVSVPRDYAHGIADTACVLENIFLAACSLGVGSVWPDGASTAGRKMYLWERKERAAVRWRRLFPTPFQFSRGSGFWAWLTAFI